MTSFLKLCQQRRSIHDYLPEKNIPREVFESIFEAVKLSPSGYNAQTWEFLVIEDMKKRQDIQKLAFNQKHITQASALIIVLGDANIGRHAEEIMKDWVSHEYANPKQAQSYASSMTKERPLAIRKIMAMRSTVLSAMTLMYAATDQGLATCPMMGFQQQNLAEYLELPADIFPVLMMTIGYEDTSKTKQRLPRKAVNEFVFFDTYRKRTTNSSVSLEHLDL